MRKITGAVLVLAGFLVAGCTQRGGQNAAETKTVGLTTDHLVAPANIGARPTFGWRMCSDRQGAAQTAYRLKVFEGVRKPVCVWDSGEVTCGLSAAVRYAGPALKSAMKYSWTVCVKDEKGVWLKPAKGFFETGLLKAEDWDGSSWISAVDAPVRPATEPLGRKQEAEDGTACFVKKIANGRAVKEAYWTVAGLGVFEAYVNGKPVSRKGCRAAKGRLVRDFLKPGFTSNTKTKYAFTYDVTHLMNREATAENVFSAQVSAGWWRDKIVNFFGKKSAFRAQLILRHEDGTCTRLGTDTSWLAATTGPVIRAAIFDGEDYDARVKRDWMKTGAVPACFQKAEVNAEFKGEILPMTGAPIRLREDLTLTPKEMYVWKGVANASKEAHGTVVKLRSYKDGETIVLDAGETLIVDFAQNAAAVPMFAFAARAGVTLTALPAEILNDANGARSRGNDGPEGAVYRANLRGARARMTYTFAGKGLETYHPEFSFFGYRYLSVSATGRVTISKVRSIPVTSIPKWSETGSLETALPDVNRLIANVLWGQYSNYLSVPTDCPQRNERLGWTADTQVFTEAALYNADVYGFLTKWMRDMRDTQHADGSFTGVAPDAQYGSQDGHRLGWADAGIIVPYTLWKQTGDLRVVEESWEAMARYMKLLDETKFASELAMKYQWADWLSYEKLESCGGGAFYRKEDGRRCPRPEAQTYWKYLGACYWLWDARMMETMAAALGKKEDEARYREMTARAYAHLRANFVEAKDGLLLPLFRDMQTPALFALKLGLLEGEAAEKTKAALRQNFKDHGDCLQTGFLGTSILMDTLTYDAGMPEMAYTLLLQRKNPSWLYSVDQGATTIWERWNSYVKATGFGPVGMNSFNHYAYGAVLAWMYGTMAGIQEDVAQPGFKRIILAPVPDKRVGRVKAAYRSPYGVIRSAWHYAEDGTWTWTFTVPANTTAEVRVPGGKAKTYAAGTYTIVK